MMRCTTRIVPHTWGKIPFPGALQHMQKYVHEYKYTCSGHGGHMLPNARERMNPRSLAPPPSNHLVITFILQRTIAWALESYTLARGSVIGHASVKKRRSLDQCARLGSVKHAFTCVWKQVSQSSQN